MRSQSHFEWKDVWRGHLLLYDKPLPPKYSEASGAKLLWVFIAVGVVIQPWLHYPFLLLPILIGFISGFAKVPLKELGLRGWSRWNPTEKFYVAQIVLMGVGFSFMLSSRLAELWRGRSLIQIIFLSIVPGLVWGFYQEMLCRGVLQTELVRRWGTVAGVLVSNSIYTFGPLHFYHYRLAQGDPGHLWIFAAIFGIGLIFSIVYHRSGNLWIVGIMHGIWPLNFM